MGPPWGPGAAWIGVALYAETAVPLTRRTASPISPSNLIGSRVVGSTTHPIRYPRGHSAMGAIWPALGLVTPGKGTPLGVSTTFSFTVEGMKKSVSLQIDGLPGHTQ